MYNSSLSHQSLDNGQQYVAKERWTSRKKITIGIAIFLLCETLVGSTKICVLLTGVNFVNSLIYTYQSKYLTGHFNLRNLTSNILSSISVLLTPGLPGISF